MVEIIDRPFHATFSRGAEADIDDMECGSLGKNSRRQPRWPVQATKTVCLDLELCVLSYVKL